MHRPTVDEIAAASRRLSRAWFALLDAEEDDASKDELARLASEHRQAQRNYQELFSRRRRRMNVWEWTAVQLVRALFALQRLIDYVRREQ